MIQRLWRASAALLLIGMAAAQAQNPAAPTPASPTEPPPAPQPRLWEPRTGAVLQALDKLDAHATTLHVADGHAAQFGHISIVVVACLVRPAGEPADAAAFLQIVDSRPDTPGFAGWMLAAEPSVSMFEHPIYDVRVIGCE